MSTDMDIDFEAHRPSLLSLAYRMLGDFQRAEDMVQDAWLRLHRSEAEVTAPRGFLLKTVTRLCLNELASARARREEARGDRLPEPVDLEAHHLDRLEDLDQVSMAFLILLQRLTGAERAVLLLRDVFDFDYPEIAGLLDKSELACRQLLSRARRHVREHKRTLQVSPETHRRLLEAFVAATTAGDAEALRRIVHEDVVLIVDAGPDGQSYGGVRNLPGPLLGARKVVSFLASVGPKGEPGLTVSEATLNGQPALVMMRKGQPTTAILLSVVEDRVSAVFMHADLKRLERVKPRPERSPP